jgi:hypothetical protein
MVMREKLQRKLDAFEGAGRKRPASFFLRSDDSISDIHYQWCVTASMTAAVPGGELAGHASSGLPLDCSRPSRVRLCPALPPLTWPALLLPKAREAKFSKGGEENGSV